MRAEQERAAAWHRSGIGRIAIAVAVLLVALGIVLWLSRVSIATRVIDRTLADRHVPARYTIADLGFGRQRLTDVVIGDPANPDLVADWIETSTDIGTGGATLAGLHAGHVRMRGRLTNGRVSLGAIDRLLPPAAPGTPFTLPALSVAVQDARMRLETPNGVLGLRLQGKGLLADGFAGRLAVASDRLAVGGCAADGVRGVVAIRVQGAAPRLIGPVAARDVSCAGMTAARARTHLSVLLNPALDHWDGNARLAVDQIATATAEVAGVGGTIGFRGRAARTAGPIALIGRRLAAGGVAARDLSLAGSWQVAKDRAIVAGRVRAATASAPANVRRLLATIGTRTAGMPIAPIASGIARAAVRAAAAFAVDADVALATGTPTLVTVRRLALSSKSGARLVLADGAGIVIGHPAGVRLDGVATVAGGGLPTIRAALSQPRPGGAISGTAMIAPFARGDARVTFTPVSFTAAPAGTLRVATELTLSGPVSGGRVDGLRMPLRAAWDGALAVNPGCVPLSFRRLSVSGLVLDPASLVLCPSARALVSFAGGRLAGGARIAAPRLAGRIGSTPLLLAADDAEVRLADRRFAIRRLTSRIGVTRLDVAELTGRLGADGLAGEFVGGSGQIATVPLLLGDAAGAWRFGGGKLSLTGALAVRDAAAAPRFQPLAARDVALSLAGGRITATAVLDEPTTHTKVADVAIAHALGAGRGEATLRVPGITFGDGFQPDLLTRLTYGVIADVHGTVSGQGDIVWSSAGVTSTGTFTTPGTDLAAAFGPVTGIAGTIRFTDLLNLESAPGQVATVASLNPGVPVTDGRIVYRTLPGNRIDVTSGTWPFAGGTLTLAPTLLDFSAAQERRMTFKVDGMQAAQFLQQFDFKNLDATGVFDGELPMIFDASGGRIANGRLTARAGGGTLAYVGDLSDKDMGFWSNMAFQALKSLRYRNLNIVMNGPLAGEMITEVRFAGISQGTGAKSNFLVRRLQKLPFVFNIRVRAPFRGLIDSAASFYDPKRLVQRNLQSLIEEQNKRSSPIQPPASESVP